MTYEEILSHFRVKSRSGNSAKCFCPAHADNEASLSITKGANGKTLVFCHAGCKTEDVLGAVGLSEKDLFEESQDWRAEIEKREGRAIEGVYTYRDINTGAAAFTRLRFPGKVFRYGIFANGQFKYGLQGRQRKDIPAVYGDLKQIKSADTVYYCEGEKDVDTVRNNGLCGVTCGAAKEWVPAVKELFRGKTVIVCQDNDDPGEKLGETIEAGLSGIAKSVTRITPCTKAKGADITDYFQDGGTVEELERMAAGASEVKKIEYITASDLLEMDLPPVEFLAQGLIIGTGLTGFVSKPKIGKSWCALDLAISVASGGRFLGRQCAKADVLYLSLEDSFQRLQDRLKKILRGKEVPAGLALAIKSDRIDGELLSGLRDHLKERPETRLIIIDTLQKIRGQPLRSETTYAHDCREVGELKQFADTEGVSVVFIHHTRKGESLDDPFSDVSGTNGIFGSADTVLIITKAKRTDKAAKLWTIGRDVPMETYEIEFDKERFRWNMLGNSEYLEEKRREEAFHTSNIVKTVKRLLEQNNGEWEGTASELMQAGRYIAKRSIATNETILGKKLSQLADDFREYAGIDYVTTKGKNGNRVHRFKDENPFVPCNERSIS